MQPVRCRQTLNGSWMPQSALNIWWGVFELAAFMSSKNRLLSRAHVGDNLGKQLICIIWGTSSDLGSSSVSVDIAAAARSRSLLEAASLVWRSS